MEKNVRADMKVMRREVQITKSVQDILQSPEVLIHVYHNSLG